MSEPVIHALSNWDYGIIAFYFLFVLSIGWVFRRINTNASDYFRGGGNMLWWVGGMAAMMAGISTWSFTGLAAKCYNDGFVAPLAQWLGSLPGIVVGLMVAPRFRRFRVITAMEAVNRRFGFGTEQFFTWVALPLGLFIGGVGLNTLGVFMASAFKVNLVGTILTVGVIVTIMATLGGQWSVAAGAFVQGILMFLIVFVVVFFSVTLPEVGGLANLHQALPARHFQFGDNAHLSLVWTWILAGVFFSAIGGMDMRNSGKFVRVKDESHARKMVLLLGIPTLVFLLPLWMQLPAMCAAKIFPDLHAIFPNLKNPEEGAWVAMSFKVLPQGLLGLMICGMFSAAIDMLDAALNTNAGFFVRNVYVRYLRRDAGERQQLVAGKVATVVLGVLMIVVGLTINALRSINLFDFFQLFNAIVFPAMGAPMILGLFVRRTPAWSGWSTVAVGVGLSILASQVLYSPEMMQRWMGYPDPLNAREIIDSKAIFTTVINWGGSAAWFFFTMLFYRRSHAEHHDRVEKLFVDLHTPVDRVQEGCRDQDAMQYKMIGLLTLALGSFMLLCMLIPNPLRGRMAFLFIGGTLSLLGGWLWAISLRKARAAAPNRA